MQGNNCLSVLLGGYFLVALRATFKQLPRGQDPGEIALKSLKVLLKHQPKGLPRELIEVLG